MINDFKLTSKVSKGARGCRSRAALDQYEYWFRRAYPQPWQRRQYLQEAMQGCRISQATFRLAHLLQSGSFANLVVTTNFDDCIERAMTVLGTHPIVCDHPITVERIDPSRADIAQIAHVHGSYWFYDCCNLRAEISERARGSTDTSRTVAAFLDGLLKERSPLIVGYAGWDGDVIMGALRRRLWDGSHCRRLQSNLYWFAYVKNSPYTLPPWLVSHPDVRFVLPRVTTKRITSGAVLKVPPGMGEDPKLSAQMVFEEFIRVLDLGPPTLTSNPLDHIANSLDRLIPSAVADPVEGVDQYCFPNVIMRIRRAATLELETQSGIEKQLNQIRGAIRASRYLLVIEAATKIDVDDLTRTQVRELVEAVWSAAEEVDDPVESIAGYKLVVAACAHLEQADFDLRLRLLHAQALNRSGSVLADFGEHVGALETWEDLLRRYGNSAEPELLDQVAWALGAKGYIHCEDGKFDQGMAVYAEVFERFPEPNRPMVREVLSRTLLNKAYALHHRQRDSEAIAAYQECVDRFADSDDVAVLGNVSRALFNKAYTLEDMDRFKPAMEAYRDVVGRFGHSDDPELQATVGDALWNIAQSLHIEDKPKRRLAILDEIIERFHESTDPALETLTVKSLELSGRLLVHSGNKKRVNEGLRRCERIVQQFGESEEPEIIESVNRAKVTIRELKATAAAKKRQAKTAP